MVSLGHKLKMLKRCKKRLFNHIRGVVCQEARKNTKYMRNETCLKSSNLSKAIAHVKAIGFAKWSVWVTN